MVDKYDFLHFWTPVKEIWEKSAAWLHKSFILPHSAKISHQVPHIWGTFGDVRTPNHKPQ